MDLWLFCLARKWHFDWSFS